jgi:sugar/nucleoside kinase (ribokinase family)
MKSALFGSLSLDQINLPGTETMNLVGGSALYASLASSLFCETGILGVLGNDYPKEPLALLEKKGIDTTLLQHSKKPSFRWSADYSADLSQALTTNRSFNSFADFDVSLLKGKMSEVKAIYVGKNDPTTQKALFDLTQKKAIQIMSTRANWITNRREDLEKALASADIFLLHDRELKLLVGPNLSLPEMIEKAMTLGPKVIVLMRDEHGLVMYGKMGNMVVPSYPMAFAVDPTGAGDAFGGALTGVLGCLGKLTPTTMRKALVLASIVASYVVEDYGTASLENLTVSQVRNRATLFLAQLPTSVDIANDDAMQS